MVRVEFAFAPDDLGFIADPYPVYAEMRGRAPIWYHEPTDHWLVSRFSDVNSLLRDRRFGRTYHHVATHAEMGRPEEPDWHGPFWHLIRNGILDMEPPDHTRVRSLVSKAFTPRMVEGMRERIQGMMDGLVDDVAGSGEFDLISRLAEPLPVAVIAELLGVPPEDRGLLRPWSADICGMYELQPSEQTARTAVRACVEFSDYLRRLSRQRRTNPRDDLVSALAQVVDDDERLTEDELIGTCVLLLNAGHEATVNVTGNGWWSLFRNPDQLARLRDDIALVPRAIEELMRWDTPLQMFERWVLEDSEVCGTVVPKGSSSDCCSVRRTVTQPCSIVPTTSTSPASPTRTCRSAPASTSAWGRRSRAWSSRRRSPRSWGGCRSSGWSRNRRGSRTTSSAGCESSASAT